MTKRTILIRSLAAGSAAAAILVSTPGWGQANSTTAPSTATPAPGDTPIDTIVVTGSRLAHSGFAAPTPVTVVGAAEIARQGATNVSEILNQVPAFRAQNTPSTSANFASNLGASTADLRGLGANRTLVLIDNRRVVAATVQGGSTTPANAVDLGMIPTSLIDRSEVVTGGASAQYGSDAVAGVVNIILNTKLEGFRGSVQYGQTDHDDGKDYAASIGFGLKLGSRGHLIVGGDYDRNKGVGDCYTRAWCSAGINTVTAPAAARSATVAAINVLPNTTTATASYNGLINAGPLAGLEFSKDGQGTFQHNYGTYYGAGLFQSGGGDGVQPYYQNFSLSVPLRKYSTFGHAEYELTDNVTAFGELSYADTHGVNPNTQNRDTAITIRNDNPYLPASVVAAMAANNITSFTMGRIGQDFGPAIGHVQRNTLRAVGGLNGNFGNSWKWDAYYQYGRTNYHQQTTNDKINDNYTRAIDAVRGPNGSVVCRVNADASTTNDDPSCSPLDIFGQNNWSTAARNYAFGTARQDTHITQQVAAGTLSGNLFDLWAGPVSFAVGGEYRKDGAHGTADPISTALRFYTNAGAAINGDLDVKEGFAEFGVPLIKDASFTHALDLNGAVRVTNYSTSGTVTSWKVGATWEPVSQLRLRVTQSRDIRAPNVFELYGPQQTSFQSVLDPQKGGAQVLPQVVLGGNSNLTPETAKTFTVGGVLQPDFWGLNRLRFSVDYYNINLENAISTLGAQLIVNLCNAGQTSLCPQIVRDSTGTITQVYNLNLNLNKVHTNGLDFEMAYSIPLSDLFSGGGGTFSIRALATKVFHLTTTDKTGTSIDRAGQNSQPVSGTSGVPSWQGNLYLTYTHGPFSGTAQVRYVSAGTRDNTLIGPGQAGYSTALANSVTINHIPAYAYLNLNASYALINNGRHKVEVFGVVNNVTNTTPPNYLATGFGGTNNVLYDVLGRAYRGGIRVAF
jgi:outer membrane receptor protein involved in Fe transport